MEAAFVNKSLFQFMRKSYLYRQPSQQIFKLTSFHQIKHPTNYLSTLKRFLMLDAFLWSLQFKFNISEHSCRVNTKFEATRMQQGYYWRMSLIQGACNQVFRRLQTQGNLLKQLQSKYIENSMEKIQLSKKKSKSKYQEQEEQSSSPNPSKLNKKIRKSRHQKKGNVSKAKEETKDELALFLQKNPTYFNQSKLESTQNLKNKLQSKIHINDVLNNQNIICFKKVKENNQREYEVYLDLLKTMRKGMLVEKVGLLSPDHTIRLKICYLKQILGLTQEGAQITAVRRILAENEYILLKLRQQIITQLERLFNQYTDSKGYNRVEVSQDLIQLLSLCKLNACTEREIVSKLDQIVPEQDSLYNLHLPRDTSQEQFLQNQLIEIFAIKNLEKSFSQTPIDFFNYHKANQHYQENNCQQAPFEQITYMSQFKKYALAKKPKSHKSELYLLRTACSACFTQFSELSNPIKNCPECHVRIHLHCQKIENRCHRCRYGRTSNAQKLQTGYCYICNRQREKGLMILTVNKRAPHIYAHEYCLLLHHFWKIQNEEFTGEYHKPLALSQTCVYCSNNQGHFFNCSCCDSSMHGMCAYLNGCSFNMQRRGTDYKVDVSCCIQPVHKERLSIQRKFKINYEKIIFREDPELYKYIAEKWKKA